MSQVLQDLAQRREVLLFIGRRLLCIRVGVALRYGRTCGFAIRVQRVARPTFCAIAALGRTRGTAVLG